MNIRLDLSYDGTNYYGWQTQPQDISVQQVLEEKLEFIFKKPIKLIGAGRTDSKAHALFYTANFHIDETSVPLEKLSFILNNFLPKDIRILKTSIVNEDFHARYSAKAREYIYWIINKEVTLPFYYNYSFVSNRKYDYDIIKNYVKIFRGRHNFNNFCLKPDSYKTTIRTIFYFRVKIFKNNIIFFIKGDGFLRGMIRSIIGSILLASEYKLDKKKIIDALDNNIALKDSEKFIVPANGLYFKRAYY